MDSIHLTPEQVEQLFAAVDRQRRFFERLHERCLAAGFPEDDMIRVRVRACLLATRELTLGVNDWRRKGLSRQVLRASKSWPRV